MTRDIIAIDVDEVLFPFMPEFIKFHDAGYGTNLSASDFYTYEFEKVLDIPFAQNMKRVYEFLGQNHELVEPVEVARDSIQRLSASYDLVVITARHPQFETSTRKWLEANFSNTFKYIHLIGYAPVMEKPATKVEVCKQLGAKFLIDDSLLHVSRCHEYGVEGILFGDFPWNQASELPLGVARCNNWHDVDEYFNGQLGS